ncbi:MAG: GerMN domain-containing protein, partial [Lachnospiraceae bacterium]|nr:GerMN domain-containing protein [Lachnospiraceae bacterium]
MNGFKHKKGFYCFTAVLFLFSLLTGCKAPGTDTHTFKTYPYITEQQVNPIQNITIYNYSEKNNRLESQVVPITIYTDQTRGEAALNYLLSTPDFKFSLDDNGVPDYSLTISGGIATVKINNEYDEREIKPQKSFAMHFCIVNTLCSIEGINYVSVFAGHKELGGNSYIGASRFLENNISSHYAEYSSSAKGASHKSVVLYYVEMSQSFIVPEQHQIYINTEDAVSAVNTIINKLSGTPTNSADLIPPISKDTGVNTIEIT